MPYKQIRYFLILFLFSALNIYHYRPHNKSVWDFCFLLTVYRHAYVLRFFFLNRRYIRCKNSYRLYNLILSHKHNTF